MIVILNILVFVLLMVRFLPIQVPDVKLDSNACQQQNLNIIRGNLDDFLQL